jgi:large subunit ribosomal protein L17
MPYNAQVSKLKRKSNQRKALLKLLAANLILQKKIKTTETKAKSVRPFIERLVTVAKRDSLASRRYTARYLPLNAVRSLHEIAATYNERNGGYTRIIKTESRRRDNTRMAFIEFV